MNVVFRTATGCRAALFFAAMLVALASGSTQGADSDTETVQLPHTFQDGSGTQWDVQQDGSIGPGEADIFDAGGRLFLGDNLSYSAPSPQAVYNAKLHELTLPPVTMAGVSVSRRISVNARQGWCRFVEVFQNPSPVARQLSVRVNFDLGGAVQSQQQILDHQKTPRVLGMSLFDGTRGIGMLFAGRGSKLLATLTAAQNSDQVDAAYQFEVPAKRTVSIVHFHLVRGDAASAQAALESAKESALFQDLGPAARRSVVNFVSVDNGAFGEDEVLRGDLQDVVELTDGDRYKGTILDKQFVLQASYGAVELPAERVAGMLTVGKFRPSQLLITTDGEAFSGSIQTPVLRMQLSSSQITSLPLSAIRRFGYRLRPGEAQSPHEGPQLPVFLVLRGGDRLGIASPKEPIAVHTRYGLLKLKPQSIAAIDLRSDQAAAPEITLVDGSHFSGLLAADTLQVNATSVARTQPLGFPVASLARLQLSAPPQLDDNDLDETAVLTLKNSDRMVGALSGKVQLDTRFDTLELNAAEMAGLHPVEGGASDEVQVTLWDGALLSGRLRGGTLHCALKCGETIDVPSSYADQYAQPRPDVPKLIAEQVKNLVGELASDKAGRRDTAMDTLRRLGPGIAGPIQTLRAQARGPVQEQLDALVRAWTEERKAATQPAADAEPNADPQPNLPAQEADAPAPPAKN